jgi:dihydrofolate reductase
MPAHVFIATSLDGFIARPNGDLDWLPTDDSAGDHGYGAFTAGIDAIVMGRGTYEKVLTFGDWPFTKPVVVLSTRGVSVAPALADRIVPMAGTPAEVSAQCAARGWHQLYIDGGVTIQGFLAAGLVDRVIVTRVPVLLGQGLPLFGTVPQDIRLEHVRTQAFENGLVQSEYRVRHP